MQTVFFREACSMHGAHTLQSQRTVWPSGSGVRSIPIFCKAHWRLTVEKYFTFECESGARLLVTTPADTIIIIINEYTDIVVFGVRVRYFIVMFMYDY